MSMPTQTIHDTAGKDKYETSWASITNSPHSAQQHQKNINPISKTKEPMHVMSFLLLTPLNFCHFNFSISICYVLSFEELEATLRSTQCIYMLVGGFWWLLSCHCWWFVKKKPPFYLLFCRTWLGLSVNSLLISAWDPLTTCLCSRNESIFVSHFQMPVQNRTSSRSDNERVNVCLGMWDLRLFIIINF